MRLWILLFAGFNVLILLVAWLGFAKTKNLSINSNIAVMHSVSQAVVQQFRGWENAPVDHGDLELNASLNGYEEALGLTSEVLLVRRIGRRCQVMNSSRSRKVNNRDGIVSCTKGVRTTMVTGRYLGKHNSYRDREVYSLGRRVTIHAGDSLAGGTQYALMVNKDSREIYGDHYALVWQFVWLYAGLVLTSAAGCYYGYKASIRHRQSALENKLTLEKMPSGNVRIDENQIIQYVNPAMRRMYGYEEGEMVGQHCHIIIPRRYRESHDKGFSRYFRMGGSEIVGKLTRNSLHGLKKDGTEFPCSLLLNEIVIGGKRQISGLFVDVSAEVEAREKIERRNDQLKMMSKMTRHDVLNHIGVVKTSLDLIEMVGFDDELFKTAQDENDAAIEFLQSISKWGRLIEQGSAGLETEVVSLNDLVEKIRPEGAKFVVDELGEIRCNVGLFQSVFRNLFENSIRHCEGRPEIYLEREYNTVRIIDNAGGFACVEGEYNESYAGRLMEPGQRGSTKADGTGMGLASCAAILDAHGFGFRHLTTCGEGTCWYIDIK